MSAKSQPHAPGLPTHKDLPDSDGAIVDNPYTFPQRVMLVEQAKKERLRAEKECLRAEKERLRARAERLAARLRELGVDPDQE